MSTVIEDFYILENNSMSIIDENNQLIKDIAISTTRADIYKKIVDDFVLFENEPNLSEVFSNKYATYNNIQLFTLISEKYEGRKVSFIDFYYDVVKMAEKYQTGCGLNPSTSIFFKTQGDKTFYRIYNTTKYRDIIEKVKLFVHIKSYEYYNNVEKPDDISEDDWSRREKEYDELFANSNSFEDSMNVRVCKIADLLPFGDEKEYKKIIDKYYNGDYEIYERMDNFKIMF